MRFERLDLPHPNTQRVAAVDLNRDRAADLVLSRRDVLLNDRASPQGFRAIASGLVQPGDDGVAIYVDLDGDGTPDAFSLRHLDLKKQEAERAAGEPKPHAWWQRGKGDGTFDAPLPIDGVPPASACAIAAGDVDRDGRTDLLIGNWYTRYGESVEAFPAHLLMNRAADASTPGGVRFEREPLPEEGVPFDEERDAGPRPIYGALIADLLPDGASERPQLVLLAYGRRWNRVYAWRDGRWSDVAPALGLDGDAERSGVYPSWAGRPNEKPFRSNGNTFDGAVGDVDGDGRMDMLIVEITHAWAGPSSDRSRLLFAEPSDGWPGVRFVERRGWGLDRIPPAPSDPGTPAERWNQGDLFGALADLDLDGDLDVLLGSGDYPDPPPFDERLRVFERIDGDPPLRDETLAANLLHRGCAEFALLDADRDGRVDLLAGQSFHRFSKEMIEEEGGTPRLSLYLNRTGKLDAPSATLRFEGRAEDGVAREGFGAVVRATIGDRTIVRQLGGPGGHSGKQSDATLVIGLGGAASIAHLEVRWPNATRSRSEVRDLKPGRYVLRSDGRLLPELPEPPATH